MSENLKKSEIESSFRPDAGVAPDGNLSAQALARRKMLLTSLGKGATVVGAVAVPMQSLAAIGSLSLTADGKRCTISGTMSAVHSKETITATCAGRRPSYYSNVANWPNYNAATNPLATNGITGGGGTFTFNKDTKFNSIGLFGSGSTLSLIDLLTSGPNSDFGHWATALLNGTLGSTAGGNTNFPYTAQQVIDLYNNPAKQANALFFFKTYMETL
jgi:hypothetical protein